MISELKCPDVSCEMRGSDVKQWLKIYLFTSHVATYFVCKNMLIVGLESSSDVREWAKAYLLFLVKLINLRLPNSHKITGPVQTIFCFFPWYSVH